MAIVLVTDGEQRSALAAVRSLGRSGHRMEVCSDRGASLAGASRHARADHAVGSPAANPADFAEEVTRLSRRIGAEIVLPATEASMLALLPIRERLRGAEIPFGELDAFRALSDKHRVTEMARELGMPVPDQRVISEPDESPEVDLGWPVVLKPSRSMSGSQAGLRKQPVRYASSPEELEARLEAIEPEAYPVLLQRRIVGPGTGLFLLRWGGETRAVFAHRRLREKPPSGGVSVYREAVPAEPDLVRWSERLLERVGWRGVGMVEFKRERSTGTPYLMEVNARLWGSLQLAVDAGVDFPRLLVETALSEAPDPVSDYRERVRSRWWWGDVDHLIARLRGERPPEEGRADRPRALAEFALFWRPGDRFEVLRWDDPRPFARETASWLAALSGLREKP